MKRPRSVQQSSRTIVRGPKHGICLDKFSCGGGGARRTRRPLFSPSTTDAAGGGDWAQWTVAGDRLTTKTGFGTAQRSVPLSGVFGVREEWPGTDFVFHTSVCLVGSKASGVCRCRHRIKEPVSLANGVQKRVAIGFQSAACTFWKQASVSSPSPEHPATGASRYEYPPP